MASAWGLSWLRSWGKSWGYSDQGAGQRKREEELWKNLPEFYQYKPKEPEQKVEVLEKVFLPPTENISAKEIAEVLASVVKKIQAPSPIVINEEDDEEALFMLMGWL